MPGLETYEGQVSRLNVGYVLDLGEDVRARLFPTPTSDGRIPYPMPVAVAYQPNNGTRYDLVFVPVRSIQQLAEPGATDLVPAGAFDGEGTALDGYVLVTRTGDEGFSYAFDLSFGSVITYDYVAFHSLYEIADASAIAALLSAVTGTLTP